MGAILPATPDLHPRWKCRLLVPAQTCCLRTQAVQVALMGVPSTVEAEAAQTLAVGPRASGLCQCPYTWHLGAALGSEQLN